MHRWLFVLAFLIVPQYAPAAEFDPKAIDVVVDKAMTAFQAPGAAVVIVKNDEIVYLRGFGVREKGKSESVTPNTVFPIASCTKAFTSTLLAMEVNEGKIHWDDKVRSHLDFFRISDELADRDVTMRDLLCHRTGMPRHDLLWAGLDLDSADLIRRWGKGSPSSSFRSTWEYSNVPFTTAGVIAGKLEKGTWADAITKRIFKPLGMKSSSCTSAEGQAAADRATPHYYTFNPKKVVPIKWDSFDQAGGAGCINSTATDMGNWLRFQLGEGGFGSARLVPSRVLRETHSPQMLLKVEGVWSLYFPPKATRFTTYGLGWFVHDYRGVTCVSHGGTLSGIRAQLMMVPEKKIGVFVVCNVRPSLFPETVAKAALDHLLDLPSEDWVQFNKEQLAMFDFNIALQAKKRDKQRKPDTKPSLPLKEYIGNFDESAYGRANVFTADDQLRVRWGKYVFRLEHYHFDTFTAIPIEPADETFSFDRSTFDVLFRLGTSGEVEGMRLFDQEFRKARATTSGLVATSDDSAKEAVANVQARRIEQATKKYYTVNGEWPKTLADVAGELENGKKDLLDPWGKEFKFEIVEEKLDDGGAIQRPYVWTERTVDGKIVVYGKKPEKKKP